MARTAPLVYSCSGCSSAALDGCVLGCAKACLDRAGVAPDLHLTLSAFGVRERQRTDFSPEEAERLYAERLVPALRVLEANDGR